jgi:hypothetical protein
MVPSKAIALKVAKHLVDTQELHPLISLSMVVCLNQPDLNQLDRWLTSNHQPSTALSKVATAVHLNSHQRDTELSQWAMEALRLQVPVAMAVDNRLQVLSGPSQLRSKALAMASEATKVRTRPCMELPRRDPTQPHPFLLQMHRYSLADENGRVVTNSIVAIAESLIYSSHCTCWIGPTTSLLRVSFHSIFLQITSA